MARGTLFFNIFIVSMMIELTFGRCDNSKKSHAIFQNCHLGKRTFGSSIRNESIENFEKMLFRYLTNSFATNFQSLYLLRFEFLQWPKVSSNMTVPTKCMKNDVSHALYERHTERPSQSGIRMQTTAHESYIQSNIYVQYAKDGGNSNDQ